MEDADYGGKGYSDEEAFTKEALDNIRRARRIIAIWRKEAREAFDMYAGRQWLEEDEAQLASEGRPAVVFNRTAPMVDAVVGMEVNNRHEVRYFPRETGDAGVNEMITSAAEWIRDNCDAEDEESDAFLDLVICGMGWTETRIDYDEDPEGKFVVERFDPTEALWDTTSRKRNLDDSVWRGREKDVPFDEFRARWPQAAETLMTPEGLSSLDGGLDDHMADEAWKYEHDMGGNDSLVGVRTVRVVHYQCRKRVPVWRVLNPASGAVETLDEAAYAKVKDGLERSGIPSLKQTTWKYHQAFFAGETLLERSDMPVDAFTLCPITGKRDRNKGMWFGLVRPMIDPQRWANKFFSQILHIINANAKGGLVAEEDVFPDQHKAEALWAAPDSIVLVRQGALSGTSPKLIPKPVGAYPQGTDRLMEIAISSLRDVTGINAELIGATTREQAGILEIERKKAAIAMLAIIFDSFRRYRKEQGRVLLQMIQRYMPEGTLVRINSELGPRYVPLVRQPDSAKYDIIVDEAPASTNQKERVWALLGPLLPEMVSLGLPIPPDVLDYIPLPESLAQKWKQEIARTREGDPLATRAREAEVVEKEGVAKLKHAQAGKAEAETVQTNIENILMGGQAMLGNPPATPTPSTGAPNVGR